MKQAGGEGFYVGGVKLAFAVEVGGLGEITPFLCRSRVIGCK